jgi:hypothetical protein
VGVGVGVDFVFFIHPHPSIAFEKASINELLGKRTIFDVLRRFF